MKRRLPLLFAIVAMAVLLGIGSTMNSACKASPHAWCAPTPKMIRQSAIRSQEGNNPTGRAASRVRLSSRK
jgi:hypothetical protein